MNSLLYGESAGSSVVDLFGCSITGLYLKLNLLSLEILFFTVFSLFRFYLQILQSSILQEGVLSAVHTAR